MPTKSWGEVWEDIKEITRRLRHIGIRTLCRRNLNDILEVKDDHVIVRSHRPVRPETGLKRRMLKEDDFRYVWNVLVRKGLIMGVNDVPKVRGRRSAILTIMAQLPYVEGRCENRRVVLELKDP